MATGWDLASGNHIRRSLHFVVITGDLTSREMNSQQMFETVGN